MNVQTIFKVLIGTIVIIVVASLVIEMFNLSTTSLQINSIVRLSAKQACNLFGQETYKRRDAQSINEDSLYANDGSLVVSGTFYTSSDPEQIYNELYAEHSSDFLREAKDIFEGNWESIDLLFGSADDEWGIGEYYRDAMMTPLNMGVPYLDRDTVTRMMKWNLTSILNNGQKTGYNLTNLYNDDPNGPYVLYKGFKVFVNSAEITDIEYEILDLNTNEGKEKFTQYTNMRPEIILSTTTGSSDERRKVCLAGVSYEVDIQYVGITPLKNIMEFVWNYRVAGVDGATPAANPSGYSWDDTGISTIQQGGFTDGFGGGQLPVPGKLIYYIIR